jgi:hypothetical protein
VSVEGVKDLGEGGMDGSVVPQDGEFQGFHLWAARNSPGLALAHVEIAICLAAQGDGVALGSGWHDMTTLRNHRGPPPPPLCREAVLFSMG